MADTPADKPKRRRPASKAAEPKASAKQKAAKPATPGKPRKADASPDALQPKRTARKTSTSKAPSGAAQPAGATVKKTRAISTEAAPPLGWLAAIGAAVAVGGAWFVWRSSRAEEPDFQLVEGDGAIEIRKYPALVTAATKVRGERDRALNEGFRTLADYIFAKSRPGPKLPMTAPVLSDADKNGGWRTRFVMPTGKARAELPAPPAGVELASEPAARLAAIRFSGRADPATLELKEAELRTWLQTKALPHEGKAVYALYNAPFLPGPLRRNEVLIRLSDEGGTGG